MRASFLFLMATLTFTGGCLASAWQDVAQHFTDTATTAASTAAASSTGTSPTTSEGPDPVATVTGPPSETTTGPGNTTGSSTSDSQPAGEPPTAMLFADPAHLIEAGESLLWLNTDDDVVKVRLSMDGESIAELTPADFPFVGFEALSAKDNTMTDHVFEVEVEDAEGLTAMATAKLSVELPPSGAQKCVFDKDKENPAVVMSRMFALVYTHEAIVAVGERDIGDGPRMTVWKLDRDHCEETLPGWPKTIADWTEHQELAAMLSVAKAVAIDGDGNIAIGGNFFVGDKPQRYTALLTADGARLWEREGLVGEEVSSVVFGGDDLVISGGWTITNDNPLRTDAMFWRHLYDQSGIHSVIKWPLKAPFTGDEVYKDPFNELSEKINAMLIEPETGFLVVVGEREFKPNNDVKIYTRAFISRFIPLGGPIGSPATSPGDVFGHEAMSSITVCDSELIAGGWTRDAGDPNATPQPLFRWASNGIWLEKKLPEVMPSTELRGAACDREGKVVGAGFRSVGSSDARVFAFEDPLDPWIWYETGAAGDDAANGVVCDARGFCAWPGYRTVNGKYVAVVRAHHP